MATLLVPLLTQFLCTSTLKEIRDNIVRSFNFNGLIPEAVVALFWMATSMRFSTSIHRLALASQVFRPLLKLAVGRALKKWRMHINCFRLFKMISIHFLSRDGVYNG